MCKTHTHICAPLSRAVRHAYSLIICDDILSLYYLHALTTASDVKNYTFLHLNNSDYSHTPCVSLVQ